MTKKPEKLQPIDLSKEYKGPELKKISGIIENFRRMAKKILTGIALYGVVGTGAGYYTGNKGQDWFRNKFDYNPDMTKINKDQILKELEKLEQDIEQTEKKSDITQETDPEYKETKNKLKAFAKKAMKIGEKFKRWTTKEANRLAGETEIYKNTKQYIKDARETIDKMNEFIEKIKKWKEYADPVTFWGPFILAFMASTYALSKLIQLKRKLLIPIPPEIDINFAMTKKEFQKVILLIQQQQKEIDELKKQLRQAEEKNKDQIKQQIRIKQENSKETVSEEVSKIMTKFQTGVLDKMPQPKIPDLTPPLENPEFEDEPTDPDIILPDKQASEHIEELSEDDILEENKNNTL